MENSCDTNLQCCNGEHELRVISLDFGRIPVDTTVVKNVKIRNDNCNCESYVVHRDPVTNPMDIAFHFDKYSWSLNSQTSIICRIQFRPILPFEKSTDYFTIVNCHETVLKIVVQGESIGPNAFVSADELVMICALGGIAKKRVKIINDSDAPALFSFDVDEKQNSFKPDPPDGFVDPRSHKNIVITFEPTFEGFHTHRLPCMVQHQAPIMILLYGYCGKHCDRDNIPTFLDSPTFISESYLDFGRNLPGSHNSNYRSPLTTCFTNPHELDMMVKWHKDVDGIFKLEPNEARVCAGESCLFEVHFDPEEENQFYTRQIKADVLWIRPNSSTPFSQYTMEASVRLMGHTFSLGSSSWVPQYKIPQTVVMPSCLPWSFVHTTFVIHKFGHLPLMFRFMPPKETKFDMDPMMGVMNRNYQIIGVKMIPEGGDKFLYERWSVIFNGNSKYEVFLDLRGLAENPRLTFSTEIVNFSPTHPGCEQVRSVTMRNPTRHCLIYSMDDLPSILTIERVQGQINPNEIHVQDWIFRPIDEGSYESDVIYFTTATSHRRTCEIDQFRMRVVGKCEAGFLLATPNELICGELICQEVSSLNFQLVNPGPTEIAYKLIFKHHDWPCDEECIESVNINPSSSMIRPNEVQNIEIHLTPMKAGLHEITINYFIRRNAQTDEIVGESSKILTIKYFCVLPVLKVEDLLHHQTVPEMSKYALWRLLNIKKLNKILNDLEIGERADLEMNFPPMIVQDEKSMIKFLISNPTSGTATWSFKRIKLCSCSKKSEKRGLSSYRLKYNCSHRNLCEIYPKSGSLKAREKTTITMELHYAVLGETKLQWDLNIGHDRCVSICMKIIGVSEVENSAVLPYGSIVELQKIYIGDRDPINQICWIYNPTANDITYSVDTAAFEKFNENNSCEIFHCSNSSGTVQALSHHPILINFRPARWAVHEVKIPLTLGSEKTEITIKGDTSSDPLIKMSQISPVRDILRLKDFPVHFSTDRLTLPATPTHSRVTRLIMIHNRSETDVIACKWKRYELSGIIAIDVEPKTTRIQPGTLQTHRVIVITGGKPCEINANVTCEFINQTHKRNYEKSLILHDCIREETKHHFTITEKGTTVPIIEKIAIEPPKPFYKTLTVSCHTYSPRDEQLKTRRKERLKNTPPIEISMQRQSKGISVTRKMIDLSKFLLEGMIWTILQTTNLHEAPHTDVKYSQIVMQPLQRKTIQARSYVEPSGRMIERILENMIFMIVHKEFGLDVTHLTQKSDARQVTYQKMWQQVASQRSTLERSPDL